MQTAVLSFVTFVCVIGTLEVDSVLRVTANYGMKQGWWKLVKHVFNKRRLQEGRHYRKKFAVCDLLVPWRVYVPMKFAIMHGYAAVDIREIVPTVDLPCGLMGCVAVQTAKLPFVTHVRIIVSLNVVGVKLSA